MARMRTCPLAVLIALSVGGCNCLQPVNETVPLESYEITFVCTDACTGTYSHTLTITSFDPATGRFSGTGVYNTASSYTSNLSGKISSPDVTFTLVYTGTNAGYTATMTGTVDDSGALRSGIGRSSEGQTYTWSATRKR